MKKACSVASVVSFFQLLGHVALATDCSRSHGDNRSVSVWLCC